MKKYLFLFAAVMLIAGTSCQQKVDIEKEKEAIMKVVQAESETARSGDVDGLKSCYIQDEDNTRLNVRKESYEIVTGWDKLGPMFEQFKDNAEKDLGKLIISKENPVIKVTGNTAWLICDNIWKGEMDGSEVRSDNIQITFLEKVDGTWKFSFAAWIVKPEAATLTEGTEATQ